ncbi:hypothetical protein WA026_002657 [Henosepilachna vigintioctopunctata]|uniref:Uncharacterized protein n=1 Tax=Henosepilachna vigintioctopunctata TaxID=420089 RepID=A0AAW1U0B1_9CUCU
MDFGKREAQRFFELLRNYLVNLRQWNNAMIARRLRSVYFVFAKAALPIRYPGGGALPLLRTTVTRAVDRESQRADFATMFRKSESRDVADVYIFIP